MALRTACRTSLELTRRTGRLLFFGSLLLILFRQKYPRWWFGWNLQLQRFATSSRPT